MGLMLVPFGLSGTQEGMGGPSTESLGEVVVILVLQKEETHSQSSGGFCMNV